LKYFLYVLRSVPSGKYYIGIAADVQARLNEHNTKTRRWTSAYKPWEVLTVEEWPDRAEAARRERFLKSYAGIAARNLLIEAQNGEGKIRSE
jgi:putative endonuclease